MDDRTLGRFWAKVDKTDTCWTWTACVSEWNYGLFQWNGRLGMAHRFAYEAFVGPIPPGLVLDHLCRVTRCVRPDHLEPVTQQENLLRGRTFQAANAAKTHCPQGHPYDEVNTRIKGGSRICRACGKAASVKRVAERSRARAQRRVELGLPPYVERRRAFTR